jgi:DNA mismatch repair protein MutS
MTIPSILFEDAERRPPSETSAPPAFFADLNFDQIVAAVIAGKDEYNLTPFFYAALHDVDAVLYRREVMGDLEDAGLLGHINAFAQTLHSMRDTLKQAEARHYRRQKEALFLDAVDAYCGAVAVLTRDLGHADLRSRGFVAFRDYLADYARSSRFTSLLAETKELKADLMAVKYALLIKGSEITVRKYDTEIDYAAEVEQTFRKFQQGAVKDYNAKFSDWPQMNHIEAAVLDRVARLYPEIFARLAGYCRRNAIYLDETIGAFDREVQFYVAYLAYLEPLRRAGLSLCSPAVSHESKALRVHDAFDLALAHKLVAERASVVCNDFHLADAERIFVVSGPNQGGKTTFARMFGQLHYLVSLGCLVPGRSARLFLPDRILTHFEREETISDLRGKLQDDLIRIHEALRQATPRSVIVMNEIFASTTLRDAIFLGTKIIERITEIGALCVCVTFVDELSALNDHIVSAVSTIVPEKPAVRTYKIVRKPADGLAYAMSIAEKYGLTRRQIRQRIPS